MKITLESGAPMAAFQKYIHELEKLHGWLSVDLIHNCFLMGEEVGELFKAIRKYERYYDQSEADPATAAERKARVAEELVDVFNYLLALANRLDIDMEQAFVDKNARNQMRRWDE